MENEWESGWMVAYALPMPCLCRAYALPMPCLCLAYALPTPCLRLAYALPCLCLCLAYALPMPCLCLVYALPMPCLCLAYALPPKLKYLKILYFYNLHHHTKYYQSRKVNVLNNCAKIEEIVRSPQCRMSQM